MTATKAKRTEGDMVQLLRARYGTVGGNGEAYALVTGVRSAAGFDARRTIDAVAMSLWPSRGLLIEAFEIKCSRSDWVRELKNPEKAEEFAGRTDRFWVVAADGDIVRDGELPPRWGLMVAHGGGLRVRVQAETLHDYPSSRSPHPLPPTFGRSYLAALLREAVRVGRATPQEVLDAEERGAQRERDRQGAERDRYKERYERLEGTVREVEGGLGVSLRGLSWPHGQTAQDVGAAIKAVLYGETDLGRLQLRLRGLARAAEEIAQDARKRAESIEGAG